MQRLTKMRERLIENDRDDSAFETNYGKHAVVNEVASKTIGQLLESSDKCFSIEVCPIRHLNTDSLSRVNANFCSITWRNPSSVQLRHVDQIPAIRLATHLRCQGYTVLMHLAGRNLGRQVALKILNLLKEVGVRNLFILQGDPSEILERDDRKCDFPYAVDLVRFVRTNFGNSFCLGVAGYPEQHAVSKDAQEDVYYLKQKVSSGADFIITQASYDYEAFKNFCRTLRTSGITVPVIPGIFIIKSYQSLISISKFCGVPISASVQGIVSANRENGIAVKEFGIHHATTLIRNILSDGTGLFAGFHLFSLNDLSLVKQVLRRLGLLELSIEYPL